MLYIHKIPINERGGKVLTLADGVLTNGAVRSRQETLNLEVISDIRKYK